MRYQDLRPSRGAGAFLLELRLLFGRSRISRAPAGRLDGLSDHQLKDLGLDPCPGEQPVTFWRIRQ